VARLGWAAVAGAALALPALTGNTYYLYLACSIGLLTIVTAGLNVLAGFTGQISLGHAGFYALGAYGAALAATRLGWPLWAAGAAGVLVAALVGAAVAAAALRVSGPYLAMVTIAFGIIVEHVLVEWVSVTGGPGGIFNIPKLPVGRTYWLIAAAAALALWLTANLRASAWGRALLAVKSSEVAAESLGLSAYFLRIVAFTISAAFAGLAGGLFALLNGYISPDSFTLQTSIVFLLALLFGGLGRLAGPLAGSVALTLLPEFLTGLADYRLILYGSLLLVSIYGLPAGVVGALAPRARPRRSADGAAKGPGPDAAGGPRPTAAPAAIGSAPLLGVERLGVSFGGVVALAEVTLAVPSHGITAVIGPNGAGKTTLLNLITGYYRPGAGQIRFAGESIAGRPPYAVARLGVARTFQTAQAFDDLTVVENVMVGVAGARLGGLAGALLGMPGARRREREMRGVALTLLATLGLGARALEPATALPAGLQRWLEIARALATRPRLLLLDEPAAGLSPAEIEELDRRLTALREQGGPAIVLVEHHMELVMAVSDRVSVLDYGRVIAAGSPGAVRANPAVIEAYLGAPA
jgi:ABC-type branched-subunit amino acid transport system ATPase component/branched-subunit amino acid ABC-type transport system permease component